VSETSVSSQLTDISDDSSVAESEEELIPKPAGEAGRPGRGGYRLSDKVELDTELFKRIRVRFIIIS
jgi:hypothetical protein